MRIYTSTAEPIDLCRSCARKTPEDVAEQKWGYLGDGPDDRGNCFAYDADHPPYDDGGMDYTCVLCDRPLAND